MSRLTQCFENLKKENSKALVTYVVSGDPSAEATLKTMHAMVKGGANIIELGVPFSDPMADGPTIQSGHERALKNKMSLKKTIDLVATFRESDKETPIVLMGYQNPIERMGVDTFVAAAAKAGVDGLICVDLPPEESSELQEALNGSEIDSVYLLAPTTTLERAKKIVACASGFLYYVSFKGVTGAAHLDVNAVKKKLDEIRSVSSLPVCVGFGIKDGETARAVTEFADGAVVGSLLVDAMGKNEERDSDEISRAVENLVLPIRSAMDK